MPETPETREKLKRYIFTLPKLVNTPGPMRERGIQGFVTCFISWSVFLIYLVWAYTPHEYLHSLGFDYIPSRWWAIVVPWAMMAALFGGVGIYLWMNRNLVHPLTSINLVCDVTSSTLGALLAKDDGPAEREFYEAQQRQYAMIPDGSFMPPTLDLSLDWVNKQLYLTPTSSSRF